jgi:LysM repeat protein
MNVRIMKKIFVLLTVFFVNVAVAQEAKPVSPWKYSGTSYLNLTQSSFSNWSSGGENSIAVGIGLNNIQLNYNKDKIAWENGLTLGYGLQYQGSKRSKTNDVIDFFSKLGYKAFGKFNYTSRITFKSQFDKGYPKYPITPESQYNSKFMSPASGILSLGFDYKPNADFSLILSPLSGKYTVVLDDSLSKVGVYGVKPNRNAYYELGTSISSTYNKRIATNITMRVVLEIFSNLLVNPENADINMEINLNFKVTKYISSNLNFQFKYDDDTKHIDPGKGPALQFKQVLGLALSYNF